MLASVLIIDKDQSGLSDLIKALKAAKLHVNLATDESTAMRYLAKTGYELVLVDIDMLVENDYALLNNIRHISTLIHIFATLDDNAKVLPSPLFQRGVYDYFAKPYVDIDRMVNSVTRAVHNFSLILEREGLFKALQEKNTQLEQAQQQLKKSAIIDSISGLYNHRYLQETLAKEVIKARRLESDVSLILMDVDSFKNYNDDNGYHEGDLLLRSMAKVLKHAVGQCDMVARFGGEKFVIVLPGQSKLQAHAKAQQLCRLIANYPFRGRQSQPVGCVTASFGVVSCPQDATDNDGLMQAAERALYTAKQDGRNRVYSVNDMNNDNYVPIKTLSQESA